MPRTMTTAMAAALAAPELRMALFASLQFGDNTIYVWSGLGPVTWNSMTFQGVGTLGMIEGIGEGSTVEAKGVKVSLSGIPSALVGEVLFETRVLRTAKIWLALYDASNSLIADPLLSYQGMMDQPEIIDDGKECKITINLENALVDMNRAVNRRYTDQDQQIDLADTLARLGLPSNTVDTGFRHVAGLQLQITFWGRTPSSVNNV
jgi:hypothetical protein